jgi:hypothetical protein
VALFLTKATILEKLNGTAILLFKLSQNRELPPREHRLVRLEKG